MRVTSVVVMLLALVASVTGQWIDRTIWVPDSMYSIAGSHRMLLDPTTGLVWFAGFDAFQVQVYDPAADAKVAKVRADISGVTTMAQSIPSHRVYVGGWSELAVIDDRDYSVVTQAGNPSARAIAYDSRNDKMYIATSYPDSLVLVYQPGPDTVIASMDIGGRVSALVYDSARNRLFALKESANIAVLDCAGDSLLAYLPVSGEPVRDIVLDPDSRRLYSLSRRSPAGNEVRVYDSDSLTVLDTIPLPAEWDIDHVRLSFNPATNRLYGWYAEPGTKRDWVVDSLAVVDCGSGAVSFVHFPDGYFVGYFIPAGSKAYASSRYNDSVAILGVPDSITGWLRFPGGAPTVAGWNPGRNEVYIADYDEQLSVVDVSSDSIVRTVDYSLLTPYWFLLNPSGKMYAGSDRELAAFGVDGSVLLRHRRPRLFGNPPAWSAQLNRLYFTKYYTLTDTLFVWDCHADSVVSLLVLPTPSESAWAVPGRNRLYLPTADALLAYDTYSDTLVATIPTRVSKFAYNPRNGLVYGIRPGSNDVFVIDPRLDSVVATLDVNPARDLAVNARDNEIYVNQGNGFHVFDGTTHERVGLVPLPGNGSPFYYVEDWNQLLAFHDTIGWAYDCPARERTRTFAMPAGSSTWSQFIWNSRNNKLYTSADAWTDSLLAVVRLPYDTVVATLSIPYLRGAMGWNPITNETYVSDLWRIHVVRDEMTGVEDAGPNLAEPPLRVTRNPNVGSVRFACSVAGPARLRVYDVNGRLVWSRMLRSHVQEAVWDRIDTHGQAVPSGVYVARLESAAGHQATKVVLR